MNLIKWPYRVDLWFDLLLLIQLEQVLHSCLNTVRLPLHHKSKVQTCHYTVLHEVCSTDTLRVPPHAQKTPHAKLLTACHYTICTWNVKDTYHPHSSILNTLRMGHLNCLNAWFPGFKPCNPLNILCCFKNL